MPGFTKADGTYGTVKLFFYTYSISKHDEYNILNPELVLICSKPKSSSKQLLIKEFFGEKSDLQTSVNTVFYLFII